MEGKLLAGWSRKDITPPLPVLLAGQFYERVAEQVRDPITATAFALETVDGDGASIEQALMISCDLLLVGKELQDAFRKRLAGRLPGFDCKKAFLFATHTHTGPFTSADELSKFGANVLEYPAGKEGVTSPEAYSDFLAGRLCEAAAEAWNARAPGGISRAYGVAAVGYNRMVTYGGGASQMYGQTERDDFDSFAGPSDPGLEMLVVWDAQGGLTGIAVNVACPSQIVEQKGYVSADFWGEVRKEISRRCAREVHVLAMTGAAGDQSPRDLVRRELSMPEMSNEEGLAVVAGRIADAVEAAIGSARAEMSGSAVFRHAVCELDLPVRRVTKAEADRARVEYEKIAREYEAAGDGNKIIENPSEEAKFYLAIHEAVVNRYRWQQDHPYFTAEVHVIRIGDIVVATNPFELYLDYGLQIKARSKARQTFIVELACDCGLYLPTARAVAGGGYSTQICNGFVGPEGGRLLVDHTVRLIRELMDGRPG